MLIYLRLVALCSRIPCVWMCSVFNSLLLVLWELALLNYFVGYLVLFELLVNLLPFTYGFSCGLFICWLIYPI